jgi:hypothetical protein
MKLPMPTAQEIYNIAERAEHAMCASNSRTADKMIIENAIRNALQIVIDRMDIQMNPVTLDLGKQ